MELGIRIQGADQTLRALSVLEPTVARKTKQAITGIGQALAAHIRAEAKGYPANPGGAVVSGFRATPSGWPAWTQVQAQHKRRGAGVVVNTTSGSDNIVAAMYEYVGNGTAITDEKHGAHLSAMFNERLGKTVQNSRRRHPGRLVIKTLNEKYAGVRRDIETACDAAVAEVNRRMP